MTPEGGHAVIANLRSGPDRVNTEDAPGFSDISAVSDERLRAVAAWFDNKLTGHDVGPGQGKPGGRIIFSMETMARNPILKLNRMRPSKRRREEMVARIALEDLSRLSRHYYASQSWQFYLLSPMLYALAKWKGDRTPLPGTIRWLQRCDSWLLRSFPGLRHYAWLSVLEFVK